MNTYAPTDTCETLTSIKELITILAETSPGLGGDLEQLITKAKNLSAPMPDYEATAVAAGWAHGGDFDGFWFNESELGSWKAAASADDAATYATAEQVCRYEDFAPFKRAVADYWLISPRLTDTLVSQGERVDGDFAGLIIWAMV